MTDLEKVLLSELLCLADSKWTLGHWYIKVMLNCRTLTDATAFAGMAQDELGHTRVLFKHLEENYQLPEHQLEFGRSPPEVHNMELLDKPPANRGDFMLAAHLAEAALWHFLATFKQGSNAELSGMVRHFGKESQFHRLNLLGWIKSLQPPEEAQMIGSLSERLPLAVRWFHEADKDVLFEAGVRTSSIADARRAFIEGPVKELLTLLGQPPYEDCEPPRLPWDARRRRPQGSAMPEGLWEFMLPTGEAAKLARRPLAVSIKDNIDLFAKN